MKKLNEIQLKENWDKLISLVTDTFSGERQTKLLEMYKHFEERMMFAPASGTAHFHNCFIGGYVEHVLHITKISRRLFEMFKEFGAHIDYTEEEVIFAALHHDLGKVGDLENDYYVPNDSKWHIENQGKYYKRGKDLNFMTVTDRAIYLLNHFGVTMSENEYLALRLTDGMYEEANKTYLMQYLEENKVKSNISILLHQADMLASRIEYENWKYQDEKTQPAPVKIVKKTEQVKVDSMKKAFDDLFTN
jgi:hypothetical protein